MITQWINEAFRGGNKIKIHFDNNALFSATKEKSAYIIYNTGDIVWFDFNDGQYQVCRIETHDDIRWQASSGV